MKDIFVNKYDHFEILLFLAGIVSTFQGILFHGVTLFSWFLLVLVALGIAEKRGSAEVNFHDSKVVWIGLVVLTMTITEVITVHLNEYPEWTGRSVKNYILMVAVFLLFFVLRENPEYGEIYFKGVMISCVVQYVVCIIEFVFFTFFNYDLAYKLIGVESGTRDGRAYICGLTTNAGMVVPAILIGLCLSKNRLVKALALVTGILINSSTAAVSLVVYFVVKILSEIKGNAVEGWNVKKITVGILSVALLILIVYQPVLEIIKNVYSFIGYRILQVAAGNAISTSSEGKHFRYYWSIPYIFEHIDILRILFGYGKNCSGIPFIEFYKQYQGEMWIPESDPMATLYDVGVVGFCSFYGLLCKLGSDLWNKDKAKGLFMGCVLVGGLFYGFQMTWVLLLEMLIWNRSYGIKVNDSLRAA